MEENNKNVTYEYKSIIVKKDKEGIWRDSCKNMGWDLDKSQPAIVKHIYGPLRLMIAPLAIIPGTPFSKLVSDHKSETKVELTFKRKRNLENKAEINRLQLQFENAVDKISKLEASQTAGATVGAYFIGIAGAAFMAGSLFSYQAGLLVPSIALAVPGFLCWILSYVSYKIMQAKKSKKTEPLIEKEYDNIYDICKKATALV